MAVSRATEANWRRLNVDVGKKLQHGANKSRSEKHIYPKEYLRFKDNILFAGKVLKTAEAKALSRKKTIFSLACALLDKFDLLQKDHAVELLDSFSESVDTELAACSIPCDEWDILGFIYQCMLCEGEKNSAGSYYTPENIARKMVGTSLKNNDFTLFDPCCGTGSLLLAADVDDPEQLWGCDLDCIAVFIAKVNLLCKYKEKVFTPHIYCCDFLDDSCKKLFTEKFDLIITNPPWGAEYKSKNKKPAQADVFSLFYQQSFQYLKEQGCSCFLLPEALLNIKTHKDLRRFMLQECALKSIEYTDLPFTSVMTGHVIVEAVKAAPGDFFTMKHSNRVRQVRREDFLLKENHLIIFTDPADDLLLKKISQQKKYDLSESIFALGIVTGDNKNKLLDHPAVGTEAICTGKEVNRYTVGKPEKFLFYDRSQLQQAAREEYYRAGEKLIYKFISGELVFAYDKKQMLLLNSANMLIPRIPDISIKTILALLNSEVLRYYYKMQFGDVKILKSNLMQLPIPAIEKKQQHVIEKLIEEILSGDPSKDADLQKVVYDCYNISTDEVKYIKGKLYENFTAQ